MHMRIGLDLDGTIVVYDDVFHRHALEQFGLPPDIAVHKAAIRNWLRSHAPGEEGWIELQRIVYGLRMADASVSPGLPSLLRDCHDSGVDVSIVSHKTLLSVASPHVDLHAAALDWLEHNGFFSTDGFGLARDRVFFEPTRAAKLERIAAEGCALFVDDLEEVLTDPRFPPEVERWLYAPDGRRRVLPGIEVFADWRAVSERVRTLSKEARAAH